METRHFLVGADLLHGVGAGGWEENVGACRILYWWMYSCLKNPMDRGAW